MIDRDFIWVQEIFPLVKGWKGGLFKQLELEQNQKWKGKWFSSDYDTLRNRWEFFPNNHKCSFKWSLRDGCMWACGVQPGGAGHQRKGRMFQWPELRGTCSSWTGLESQVDGPRQGRIHNQGPRRQNMGERKGRTKDYYFQILAQFLRCILALCKELEGIGARGLCLLVWSLRLCRVLWHKVGPTHLPSRALKNWWNHWLLRGLALSRIICPWGSQQ